ncbi:diguanylate cyclase/phosphodiesterase [Sulfuriferula multivorans]|uniref:Diguanylate cyclase/phosphodiesterase n=1 Tax=Sulfuriferula multivorans TaxID=1559896 RepID=A0A401JHL3_9PROT|nr:EAL domain-containing protein [Sulfuriferula multivorans]GBL47491.1 diguanylate cyclase/phosphodiesterase [Sulfuriferula multivorans]
MFVMPDIPPRANLKIQLENLMEAAGDAVFQLNDKGEILSASKRTIELIKPDGILIGLLLSDLAVPEENTLISAAVTQAIQSGRHSQVNVQIKTHASVHCFDFLITAYATGQGNMELLAVGRNIAQQLATEESLRHLATHDALTGLPNRSLLSDRLSMAMAQARRTGKGFAVVALDLDGFKKINDALGHPVGDVLLREASMRLRDTLRDTDTLARVGGDEFIALLPNALTEADIQIVARRMIAAIQLPFEIQGHALYVSTSIGIATYPNHGDNEVALLAHADLALYRAKETGKARYVLYDPQTFTKPVHDVSIEAAMFEAVKNGEFLLHYQPVVDATTRQIMGFEALMRWMHPDLGLVPPIQFIPMAENNGLITLLGAWVLKAACVQIRHFEEAAGRQLYISVNVSPRQFRNDHFLETVDEAMKLSDLQGSQLLLEITEGILMSDPDHAETLLTAIAARGVRIAIDDFGTGYSSLAYLKRFPINTLKIDRTFVKDLPGSVKDAAICDVVISLASHLNLNTIAEGVEDEQQLQFLAKQGCTLIQGFLTGHPMLPDEAIAALKANSAAAFVI